MASTTSHSPPAARRRIISNDIEKNTVSDMAGQRAHCDIHVASVMKLLLLSCIWFLAGFSVACVYYKGGMQVVPNTFVDVQKSDPTAFMESDLPRSHAYDFGEENFGDTCPDAMYKTYKRIGKDDAALERKCKSVNGCAWDDTLKCIVKGRHEK